MRYGCEDIKYLLDHADRIPDDEAEFLNHIDNCRQCARLTSLEPEPEEILLTSTPRTSHKSFEEDILNGISKYEKECAKSNRGENLIIPVLIFFSALSIFFSIRFWKDIISIPGILNPGRIYANLQSGFGQIPLPKVDLTGITGAIVNSPLIILSIIAITALVWAFSILEVQKALK